MILNNHDTSADASEQAGRFATDVTKALSATLAPSISIPARRATSPAGDKHSASGGFFTTEGAAEVDRFAGDHAGDGGAMVHGVGVHHPCHHFAIGADVRRRNIFCGPIIMPISLV